ncbi:MAG: DUF2752 domain-containing protein [Verrucomicrobia bacterium]|jgi:hypothetical protein|nr:DUF2752 domain-containing protein [Verrucomicrobiota bacterium]
MNHFDSDRMCVAHPDGSIEARIVPNLQRPAMTHALRVEDNSRAGETCVPPRLEASVKRKPAWFAVGGLAVVAMVTVIFWFNPAQYRFYPFCFFYQLTGLQCPGCGGLRAIHQLLHGHVLAALHLNALLVILLPLFAWLGIRFAAKKLSPPPGARPFSTKWLWLFLALAAVFAVLRNLPAFAWLAP